MNVWRLSLLLALAAAALVACGGDGGEQAKQPPQPGQTVAPSRIPPKPASSPEQVAWTYDPGAVTLSLWADPRLNEHQGDSHALMLCVLQLKNAQSYQELTRTAAGLTRMLACKRFDEHVAGAKKVFVQPGQNATHVMDRVEGAKYVALVAGYYDLSPGPGASRLFEVPLHVSDSGILFTTLEYVPASLKMEILLGPHEMQMIGSQ